jgi:hypothetical protein
MRARRTKLKVGPAAPLSRRRAAWPVWVAALSCSAAAGLGAVGISGPADATITHNQSNAPQAFAEQTWSLTTGVTDVLGATVTLDASPFQNAGNAALKADCKLNLRLLSAAPLSGWAVTTATDQTNFAGGDSTARVSARSSATGNATVGLTVTFQNSDFSTLGAGNYTVTVIGTIQGNL